MSGRRRKRSEAWPRLTMHPDRFTLIAALALSACGGGGTAPPPPHSDPPAVAGTYDVTGESTSGLGTQFTFTGPLALTQAGDPPGETLGGTLTLTYSFPQFSTLTVALVQASVDGNGSLSFLATTSAGPARWTGSFNGTAIVSGRFGCQQVCYTGIWRATRR